jgi:hypothetical protein
MARRQVQKAVARGQSIFGVSRHGPLERVTVRIGHAGNHDAVDAFGADECGLLRQSQNRSGQWTSRRLFQ